MSLLKKIWIRRHSVFFSWLVSYISIMAIPLAISLLIYFETERVLENEIHQANVSILKQVQEIMDNHIKNVERLSLELAFNSHVEGLMYAHPPMTALQRYIAYLITRDLNVYDTANNYIDQIYVYYKDIDFVVKSSSMADGRGFYDISDLDVELTFDQWKKMMNGYHLKEYIPLFESNSSAESRNIARKIAYIQSIPIANRGNSYANIVIMINKGLFQEAVQNIKWLSDGIAFIIDDKDNILASNKPLEDVASLKYNNLNGKSGLLSENFEGKKAAVSYITSNVNNWKYVSVIPSSIFWEKSEYVRKIAIFSIMLCLLFGSVAAFLFLKKNYKPVNSLINALAGRAGILFNKEVNEYGFIQEAISKTLSEKENIHQILEKQKNIFKDDLLQGLLYGRQTDIAIEDHLALLGMDIVSEYYAVMLFYINDIKGLLPEGNESYTYDQLKLAQFIISNVVSELADRKNRGSVCKIDNNIACIINFREEFVGTAQEDMDELAINAQQFISENFNIHFTVSISNIHNTIAGIPEAYREALHAMEYKMAIGLQEIIHYNSMRKALNTRYYYPLEVEQQLCNHIRSGDFEKANILLDEVFDINFRDGNISTRKVRQLISDLSCTIIKTFDGMNEYAENAAFTEYEFYEPFNESKPLNEMRQNIQDTVTRLCREIRDSREKRDHKSEFIDKVSDYIKRQYSDVNLSISSIASEFEISPDYLSRLFKEKTSQGILDFLNKVRLEKAKKLITENKYTMKDIANKVGYNTPTTFIRAFKRYEGVTPGEYKSL